MLIRIIDAYPLGYAHHHAMPDRKHGSMQIQAVIGILERVRKSIKANPDASHLVVWEGSESWRKKVLPDYKTGRVKAAAQQEMRKQFDAQIPWIKRALSYFPVVQAECSFADSDDLAWGFSRQFEKQGFYTQLITANTGWLQMVSPRVEWENARKSSQVVRPENILKETGFPSAEAVAWCKAIAGDLAEGIPGVPDISVKRALDLVLRHGSPESIIKAYRNILSGDKLPAYQKRLSLPESVELIRRNEKLVVLPAGRPIRAEEISVTFGEFDPLGLYEIFHDLGITEWTSAFASWERALDREMSKSEQNCISRAVAKFASSWWSESDSA